jgi:hypothetical protein
MKERNDVAKMSYSEMKHKEGSEEVAKANVLSVMRGDIDSWMLLMH